jgi:hypothetical protein
MRTPALWFAVVAIALTGCDSGASDQSAPKPRPSPAITRAELDEHLTALQRIADENGGNRSAGTAGYDASADYVAARLRDAGWAVTRQAVPFRYFQLHDASLAIAGRRLAPARDFQVLSYSGSGRVTGRLRASGLGCTAGDYAGLEPGDVALVGRDGCFFREKAAHAERAGAGAVVVMEAVRSRRGVPSGTLVVPGVKIPVVVVSLRALRGAADGARVRVSVDASSRAGRTDNVIAETPGGSDQDVVMAGAHLDSVRGGPGIDDDGSGVASLIESAEAIGPKPPRAKVRVAFWAAEELGLVGSRHYVKALDTARRRGVRAYINLDMVGSPNPVPQLYADGDPALARVLRRAAHGQLGGAAIGGASDHAFFKLAGIPVNGLYTGSSERGPGGVPRDPCYHLACDTTKNVDLLMLLRMARTTARTLRALSAQAK